MTTARVVEMSVTANNNSPVQHYIHLDDHTQSTFEMTLGSNLSQFYDIILKTQTLINKNTEKSKSKG